MRDTTAGAHPEPVSERQTLILSSTVAARLGAGEEASTTASWMCQLML